MGVINLLEKNNWILAFHRLKTPIAEIDLIFEKDEQVLLIEVKTLNDSWRAFGRIQEKQLTGLRKNFIFFSNRFKTFNFKVLVAWVDQKNQITFVDVS